MYYRTIKRIVLGWILLIVLVALLGKVSVAASNGGNSAADFLLIGTGADAAGMGNAYSAVSAASDAAYWNPAGLVGSERTEIQLNHFMWYQDISIEHAAVALPAGERLGFAAAVTYVNYGDIQGYNSDGSLSEKLTAYDLSGGVSCGYAFSDYFSSGVTLKYVAQSLADQSASTFAVDLGLKYHVGRVTMAAVAANVGPQMKFDGVSADLPTSYRLGIAVRPFGSQFITAVDVEKKAAGEIDIRHGFQVNFNEQYYLRAGYNYYPQREYRTFGNGVSLGAGFRLNRFGFDYAFTPADSYTSETIHRFSVVFSLGR
jgi:hypothetical protein